MNWAVFLGVTVVLAGGAAYMTGQAIAGTWRPAKQVCLYILLLGFADRFIIYSLFGGELLSFSGYVIDTLVLMAIGLLAFRIKLTTKMVSQYPWRYKRAGLFAWVEV